MFAAEFQEVWECLLSRHRIQDTLRKQVAIDGESQQGDARAAGACEGGGPAIFEEEERTPAKQCLQNRCGRYRDTGGWDWRRKKNALEILAVDHCGFDPWTVGNVRHSTLWHLQYRRQKQTDLSSRVLRSGTPVLQSWCHRQMKDEKDVVWALSLHVIVYIAWSDLLEVSILSPDAVFMCFSWRKCVSNCDLHH